MGRREYTLKTDVVYECGRWLVQVIDGRGVVVFERAFHRRSSAERHRGVTVIQYQTKRRQLALPGIDR